MKSKPPTENRQGQTNDKARNQQRSWRLTSIDETRQLARKVARGLKRHWRAENKSAAPLVVFLSAPLGGGKTTFCRLLLQELGWEGDVPSPTYGIFNTYVLSDASLYHLDAYRIDKEEFAEISDSLAGEENSALFIEWPEKIGAFPKPDLLICIKPHQKNLDERTFELRACSRWGEELLRRIIQPQVQTTIRFTPGS